MGGRRVALGRQPQQGGEKVIFASGERHLASGGIFLPAGAAKCFAQGRLHETDSVTEDFAQGLLEASGAAQNLAMPARTGSLDQRPQRPPANFGLRRVERSQQQLDRRLVRRRGQQIERGEQTLSHVRKRSATKHAVRRLRSSGAFRTTLPQQSWPT